MTADSNDKKPPSAAPTTPPEPAKPFAAPRFREVIIERRPPPTSRRPLSSSPSSPPPSSRSGPPRGFPRPKPPPPPPRASPEAIAALARKAKVPARIARRELEEELTCVEWRTQNPEEALRYDRVYALVDTIPMLTVEAAIALEQSGVTVESWKAKQAEKAANEALREARKSVPGEAIDEFRAKLIEDQVELAVVLGDKVLTDKLTAVGRLSLTFAEAGEVPSLDVVAIAPKAVWPGLRPIAKYDEKLVAAPARVDPTPSRRPAVDPRPFVELVGSNVTITLRIGVIVTLKLAAVGPYDLLLGTPKKRLLVPIHALAAWSAGE